ncbi:hypothetical protein [Geothrix sp. PMB-07]|uniref:hypothetical protein n=1 Tax=Geothrix sp. PMB-07 TaxID=3068640 RepID=UPI00274046F4|nr:hypothetical protein [Geothrix sp. PMB-07]WLT30076.1 hypothetical protein Q9293_10140 [Geothrix sp. PMB-07]
MKLNVKELQKELAQAQSELGILNQTGEQAQKAIDQAQERVVSATERIAKAQAAFGRALVMGKGEEPARVELENAQRDLASTQNEIDAVLLVHEECNSRDMDTRRNQIGLRIRELNRLVREAIVQQELSKVDQKTLQPLLRAWAFEEGPGTGHGFAQWFSSRYQNFILHPEEMKRLGADVRSEYGV